MDQNALVVKMVEDFNNAWVRQDVATAVSFFTDNATTAIFPKPPSHILSEWTGKEQLTGWIQSQVPGFKVDISNIQISGNKVTWNFTASSDVFRQMGVDMSHGIAEVELENGKFSSFKLTFDPATVAIMAKGFKPPAVS